MVYIIGKVTGEENNGIEKFEDMQRRLSALGIDSVIPHVFIPSNETHEEAMRLSIKHLLSMDIECDAVLRLDYWNYSNGAICESSIADELGLTIFDEDDIKMFEDLKSHGA